MLSFLTICVTVILQMFPLMHCVFLRNGFCFKKIESEIFFKVYLVVNFRIPFKLCSKFHLKILNLRHLTSTKF